ncbi:MAG: ParB N-terminal domain-containing protein [Thermodesulfobacteriota bacterium]
MSLADILPDDRTYLITTEKDKDDTCLERSIAQVGLLSPPILQPAGEGVCRVVTGFRRLAVLRRLNFSKAPCRLVNPATDALACLKIAIADNAWQRSLNTGEQSRAVYKLRRLIDDPKDLRPVAASLGLPSSPDAIDKLLAIHALPEAVFNLVAAGSLAFSTGLSLAAMAEPEVLELAGLFTDLKLGVNRQREALLLIQEITAVEGISCLDLLVDIRRQAVVNEPGADRGLRCDQLFRYLHRRRFPHLSRAEEEFAEKVRALKPGPRAKLSPPADFEGPDYTLSLTFRNRKDLDAHLALLRRIIDGDLISGEK